MNRIPEQYRDLRRHVFLTDLRRIVGYVLWVALFLGSAVFYNYNHQTYSDDRKMLGWRLFALIVFALVTGFFLFRIWKFFTDRTFSGKIEQSGLTHDYTPSDTPYGFKPASYAERIRKKIRIRTSSGRVRRLRFDQRIGSYWYYAEGQEIVHFHGCPYPLNLDPEAPHGYVCVACGKMHGSLTEECDACFLSMIDPKEIAAQQKKP